MNERLRNMCYAVMGLAALQGCVYAQAPQLRPEIVNPLQASERLIAQGNYQAAMALITQAESVPNKTECEQWMVNSMRDVALVKLGKPLPQPTLDSTRNDHGCVQT